MAGYSATPLAHKLGIRPEARLALVHAPAGFTRTLVAVLGRELAWRAPGARLIGR